MKTRNKVLLTLVCAVALVAGSVFGTYAYLTSKDTVTNTFTVGNVQIILNEKNLDGKDANGLDSTADRDNGNKYHLLPGLTYEKDPTVTILKDSERAYVRMKVKVTNLDNLKAAIPQASNPTFYGTDGVFLLQNLCVDENGISTWDPSVWEYVDFDSTTSTYEFRYLAVVEKNTTGDTVMPALFKNITVPGTVRNEQLAYLQYVTIDVTAHAIQADGFTNADAAWTAFDIEQP